MYVLIFNMWPERIMKEMLLHNGSIYTDRSESSFTAQGQYFTSHSIVAEGQYFTSHSVVAEGQYLQVTV